MKVINAVTIGKLIEAHMKGDNEMFMSYANFIAEAYEEVGDMLGAKIIRKRIDGTMDNESKVSLDKVTKPTWIIHFVIPDNDEELMSDSHTHGLEDYNHPNLMTVLAFSSDIVGDLLNSIGLRIANGENFDEEKIYTNILANEMRTKVIRTMVGKNDMAVLILPDENNKLPGEEGCNYPYDMQLEYLEKIKRNYEERGI